MAIDTKSVTDLITEFRTLQGKDSVSPESLGYILQRILDLIATAGTSDTIAQIQKLIDGFKLAGSAIVSIKQGSSDPNNVYAYMEKLNLENGTKYDSNDILIQQATTERAGAMPAQQVININTAMKAIAELENTVESLKKGASASSLRTFSVITEEFGLKLYGHKKLIDDGYVPYIFRLTKKCNRYKHKVYPKIDIQDYCGTRIGWNLYGSCHAVKILSDDTLAICTDKKKMSIPQTNFSNDPKDFVHQYTNKSGIPCVGWGMSIIRLHAGKDTSVHRMIKLRFAVAFGRKFYPGCWRVTPEQMVTPLVEFSLVYDPITQLWFFGK